MSINNFYNKIKDNFTINRHTIVCLLTVIMVGLSAFGLGQLSIITNNSNKDSNIIITDREVQSVPNKNMKRKKYIASKNGKLFYRIECSSTKKILTKNIIWFGSVRDALEAGYKQSSSC